MNDEGGGSTWTSVPAADSPMCSALRMHPNYPFRGGRGDPVGAGGRQGHGSQGKVGEGGFPAWMVEES
jgi:hypothetical protein